MVDETDNVAAPQLIQEDESKPELDEEKDNKGPEEKKVSEESKENDGGGGEGGGVDEATETETGEAEEVDDDGVFINEGLIRWEESRANWLKSDSSSSSSSAKAAVPHDVDEIIDLIFSQRWRASEEKSQFPEPVPLPQMVDILVDLWEAEGLDI